MTDTACEIKAWISGKQIYVDDRAAIDAWNRLVEEIKVKLSSPEEMRSRRVAACIFATKDTKIINQYLDVCKLDLALESEDVFPVIFEAPPDSATLNLLRQRGATTKWPAKITTSINGRELTAYLLADKDRRKTAFQSQYPMMVLASREGNVEVLRMLLVDGPDPYAYSIDGYRDNALSNSFGSGQDFWEVIDLLIDHGPNPWKLPLNLPEQIEKNLNSVGGRQITDPVRKLLASLPDSQFALFKKILALKPDHVSINSLDANGFSAMHHAVSLRNEIAIKRLLSLGANVDVFSESPFPQAKARGFDKRTPFQNAVLGRNICDDKNIIEKQKLMLRVM